MTETDKQLDLSSSASGQRTLAWEAPEFEERTKSTLWQIGVWLVGFALAGIALFFYKITFIGIISALAAIAAALALTTQGRVKPEVIRVTIDEQGVSLKGELYAWKELKGFWIVFSENSQMLYLETTRRVLPNVGVQLGKTDPELARSALLAHIPEHAARAEELSDRVARFIKF